MSYIELLPDDLLSEILVLIDDKSAPHKIALAQVSRRWRAIAHDSPLLWSSVRVATKQDWRRLPMVLELAGSSSMLDVEIYADVDNPTPSSSQLATLVPYAPRLRTLVVRSRLAYHGLAPLFGGQVGFPVLDTLLVDGPPMNLNLGVASAPALRVLNVSRIFPVNLETLLSPTLEELRLFQCGTLHGRDLPPIFTSCPNLRTLTFHTFDYDGPHLDIAGPVSFLPRLKATNIRTLDLQLALGDIVNALAKFEDVALPEITASIYNGHDEEDVEALCDAMLSGLGALSSFEVQDSQCIVLRDIGGRVRTMRVWNDDSCWDIEVFWCQLSLKYSLHTTVRHVRIATIYWDELAEALAAYPIQTAQGVKFQILTDWQDVQIFRQGSMRQMRDVSVPGLDSVELACRDRTGLPPPVVVHILRRLPILHTRTVKVVVVVDGGVPQSTPLEVWKESISDQVTREGQGRWDLVFM